MKIKWHDKSNSVRDFSRWEAISRDKALGMLKRASGVEYENRLHCLTNGEDVIASSFTLREDNSKFLYRGADT